MGGPAIDTCSPDSSYDLSPAVTKGANTGQLWPGQCAARSISQISAQHRQSAPSIDCAILAKTAYGSVALCLVRSRCCIHVPMFKAGRLYIVSSHC